MNDQHEEVNMGSTIWQSQSIDPPHISLEFVHYQSDRHRRSLKNERGMFYIVTAAAVVSGFISIFKHWIANKWNAMDVVIDLSMLLFGLGLIFAAFHLRRHLNMKQVERNSDVVRGLTIYRSELERLIQLAYQEWRVLLYFAPGYLTLLIGGLIVDQRPGKFLRYGITVVAGTISVCLALWTGRKRNRCLQRELDAITSLK